MLIDVGRWLPALAYIMSCVAVYLAISRPERAVPGSGHREVMFLCGAALLALGVVGAPSDDLKIFAYLGCQASLVLMIWRQLRLEQAARRGSVDVTR
jgi:hypothetical protein